MGNVAVTRVPFASEWISRLPPSCPSRSRIPLTPTPLEPDEVSSDCFSGGTPLPASSISSLRLWLCWTTRIAAVALSECL